MKYVDFEIGRFDTFLKISDIFTLNSTRSEESARDDNGHRGPSP